LSAVVLPFPVTRRLSFIERQAEVALGLKQAGSERYIQHQIDTQAAAMRRKGVSEDLVQTQVADMESAIRAVMRWHRSNGAA
jgi:predicted GIY-YIG superfamily endonuclease